MAWLWWILVPLSLALVVALYNNVFVNCIVHLTLRSSLRLIPGPKAASLLTGNIPEILNEDPLQPHLRWSKQFGPIVKYRFMLNPRVVVSDPELVKQIFAQDTVFTKYERSYQLLSEVLGDALLTVADPEVHAQQRRLINHAFSIPALKNMLPVFDQEAGVLIDKWTQAARDHKDVDIHADLTKMTVDVIGQTGFDYKFHAQQSQETLTGGFNEKEGLFTTFGGILKSFSISPLKLLPFYKYLPVPDNLLLWKRLRKMFQGVDDVVAKKRAEAGAKPDSDVGPKKTIIDILLNITDEQGHGLDNLALRNQSLTFLLAGHETTSTALSWCLYLMAQHPEISARVNEELRQVYGEDCKRDIHPTYEEVEGSLKYLNAVVKETLRFYPPAALVARQVSKETTLGGYHLPAGFGIVVSPLVMHMMPNLWDEPEKFNPDRWFDEGVLKHPYQYIPFLMGSRNCIGQRFALLEMKIVLAKLLHRFSFTPVPGIIVKPKLQVTMRPSELRLFVQER